MHKRFNNVTLDIWIEALVVILSPQYPSPPFRLFYYFSILKKPAAGP